MAEAFVQDVADTMATVALAKEEDWEYELSDFDTPPATITLGLDGTCMLICEDGECEAKVGTIGFYARDGERFHTISRAATPEYGKQTFFERFDREIDRAKAAYPEVRYVGMADGALENWLDLNLNTDIQFVDLYHATQFIWKAADPLFLGAAKGTAAVDPHLVPSTLNTTPARPRR